MSGQWPPEWEDPDDGHPDAGLPDREHPDAGYSDHDLSEVTSLLASVRSPALPASVRGADQRGHRGRGGRAGDDRAARRR